LLIATYFNILAVFFYLGVPATPSASGSKSAAGSRGAAKPQKELPPVAFLRQRHHRLPSLRAFHLPLHAADGRNFASEKQTN